ncbi:hypothetical protein R3P38DRAFT_3192970 [Favolaschia claudopus]|uniref:Yeast cell wall synthesis Kre9/Knh1-like N-terminal domain-containing protein n=1 Tax=Favolaschia claudopus TaxID=2862362 RepID=A0AAW0BIY9_9AGAR
MALGSAVETSYWARPRGRGSERIGGGLAGTNALAAASGVAPPTADLFFTQRFFTHLLLRDLLFIPPHPPAMVDASSFILFAVSSLLLAASVSGFTISAPVNARAGHLTDIHWTYQPDRDPATFNLFLTNASYAFNVQAILGENLRSESGEITVVVPVTVKAGEGYALLMTESTNWDWILASSPTFSIAAA